MLKQICVRELRDGTVKRENGFIAICMRHYPRGIKKELSDIYIRDLSPDEELFKEFRKLRTHHEHNWSFETVHYEEKFYLGNMALDYLQVLANMSREKDVYIVCQCEVGIKCHRELLLLTAQKLFQAPIEPPKNDYEIFISRIERTEIPMQGFRGKFPQPL
jgi:uncharacterized protein YeaO (DUF488 family)